MAKPLDAMKLLKDWKALDPGASAQIRRATTPEELRDIPAFYRLVQPLGWHNQELKWPLLRMVFCLSAGKNAITNTADDSVTLGKALAEDGKISEQRLFQLVRSDPPTDMVQLRRLIRHAEPTLNWEKCATQLFYWSRKAKRQLLEDFVLNSPKK